MSKKKKNLLDQKIDNTNAQLVKAYKQQADKIINECEKLYLKLQAGGQLSLAELYRQDRYYQLLGDINKRLNKLGAAEVKIINSEMLALYQLALKETNQWARVDEKKVQEVIDTIWCSDGKLWSDRIWQDKVLLQQELSDNMMNAVIQGIDSRKVAAVLAQRMNVARHRSECIVRTEMCRIQNKAAMEGYIQAGYTKYKYLAAHDSRTSDICLALDGQVFSFAEAQEGINFPPTHPNCRSTIIAYKGE